MLSAACSPHLQLHLPLSCCQHDLCLIAATDYTACTIAFSIKSRSLIINSRLQDRELAGASCSKFWLTWARTKTRSADSVKLAATRRPDPSSSERRKVTVQTRTEGLQRSPLGLYSVLSAHLQQSGCSRYSKSKATASKKRCQTK